VIGWQRWTTTGLAFLEAGWMAFDGIRVLTIGDYVTMQDGQLGPWADLVSAVGIEPRSTSMKLVFAVYGPAWLAIVGAFAAQRGWAGRAKMLAAAGSLLYLPIGTLFSAA
jgi:hypothetical protein